VALDNMSSRGCTEAARDKFRFRGEAELHLILGREKSPIIRG
jgi:hypothetical protein